MTAKVIQQLLDDKIAIVTGAARGIGRATAELLLNHGARVLMTDLDGDTLNEASGCISKRENQVATLTGDVTDPEFPAKVMAEPEGQATQTLGYNGAETRQFPPPAPFAKSPTCGGPTLRRTRRTGR